MTVKEIYQEYKLHTADELTGVLMREIDKTAKLSKEVVKIVAQGGNPRAMLMADISREREKQRNINYFLEIAEND